LNGDFILAQLSDMHVTASPRADGFDAGAMLRRALAEIEQFRPDAIIATGDLVNDARADEYAALADIIGDIATPLYLLPGNHDDRALMRDALALHIVQSSEPHLSFVVDKFALRLICIDQTTKAVHGDFTPELAHWLDTQLAQAPDKPTILALHHPPFLTHDRLFDRIGLQHADRFAAIVAKHKQIVRILCGHHHRSVIGQIAHAPVVCAPSTAWGFGFALRDDQDVGRRLPETGWALHVWREGAGLATHFMPLQSSYSAG
jgi:3',5'-cyclic AMP phosphodiesterase CpdA